MRALSTTAFVIALLATGCMGWAEDCRYTAPRDAEIATDGASRIRIVAGAGSLRIDGRPGAERVSATGTACASRQDLLDDVELITRRSGDEIVVETRFPEGRWSEQMRLDLVVEVPDSLPLDVHDTSGSTEVRKVGSLRLEDGSGSIWIEDVAGDATIVDGSGSLTVAGVGGDLRIEDGSGGIDVSRVDGGVEIEDGSGEIEVRNVGHDVVIDEDGSGGIDVSGVEGSFLVRDDGSGSIDASDVRGDFTVEHDGSGSIRHDRIGGRVSVPAEG
jgi:hypothetical protein